MLPKKFFVLGIKFSGSPELYYTDDFGYIAFTPEVNGAVQWDLLIDATSHLNSMNNTIPDGNTEEEKRDIKHLVSNLRVVSIGFN